ncbi:hypothetical protein E2C01_034388 [Portunus trituberculatus]|uniref:Uncharacterized protein n=1 Tax=Portunus trituberculatus TaxID=210409 RepID=A0A5B7F6J1_PORTR|nr:hypothetical protein [Portunus trituberculatus]
MSLPTKERRKAEYKSIIKILRRLLIPLVKRSKARENTETGGNTDECEDAPLQPEGTAAGVPKGILTFLSASSPATTTTTVTDTTRPPPPPPHLHIHAIK